MNLREIRTRVENETRHYPDLVSHREDLNAVINAAYENFCDEFPWPWLMRRAPLLSFPDLTIANAGVSLATGWGPRTLQLPSLRTGAEPSMFGLADQTLAASLFRQLPGAEVELADPTLRGELGGAFARQPFTIECVVNIDNDTCAIQLDPRFELATPWTADVGDLVIRFRRLLLPPDVKQVVALRDENDLPITAATPTEAHRLIAQADRDTAGTSRWFLEDFGTENRLPVAPVDIFLSDPVNSPFAYQRETWPMRETIEITNDTQTGTPTVDQIPAGVRIRVFCCWFWAGRFGPPSNVAELETTGEINGIDVTGFPVLPTSGSEIEFGRRVAVFMAEGEGAFFLRAFVRNPALTTININSRNTAGNSTSALRFPRWDELYPSDGPYTYIRIAPRPTATRRLELEYRARPRKLIEDTDQPEFRHSHEVLVWLALAQMLASPRYNGNPAGALAMAEKYRAPILADAGIQARYALQRGQVDQPSRPGGFFVGPDIDYVG